MAHNCYPNTLISEIIYQIDPLLFNFYEERKGNVYYREDFNDFVTNIINNQFRGLTSSTELRKIGSMHWKQFIKKKRRWLETLKINAAQIDPASNSKQYPFKDLYNEYKILSEKDFKLIHEGKSFEEMVQIRIKEAEQWLENNNAYLIEYPGISSLTPKRIIDSYEMDLILNIYRIIEDRYNLDISNYLKTYIDEMSEGAYFTDNRRKYSVDTSKDFHGEIPMSEDGSKKLLITISQDALNTGIVTLFDEKDRDILGYIIACASQNPLDNSRLLLELSTMGHYVYKTKNISANQYDDLEKRCYKIVNQTYNRFEDGKQLGAINYLNSAIKVEIEGRMYMDIRPGDIIREAVLDNKLRKIPAADVERLESKIGRIMAFALQKERIKAFHRYKNGISPDCSVILDYNNFLTMANFGSSNKHSNLRAIKEALLEYKLREIMIKDVEVDMFTSSFKIIFIPLSEDEEKDLELLGFKEFEE